VKIIKWRKEIPNEPLTNSFALIHPRAVAPPVALLSNGSFIIISSNGRDVRRARQSGNYEAHAQDQVDNVIRRQAANSARRAMRLK
jgi:hypothetical protein